MGLQKIIRKHKEKEKEMRVQILGLDNAGKTTVVKKFKDQDIHTISPTLGFNIDTQAFGDINLNFWDIGGQASLRSYWKNYYENTDGLIWVVDSCDKNRLNDCKAELRSMLKQEKLSGATLLIFCNKQDVEGALKEEEIRDFQELDLISTRHWGIIPCSAVTGFGLYDGIEWLVDDMSSRVFMND